MSESTKTLKALREEGLSLARKAQAVFADLDNHTPEEIAEATEWHNQSVAIIDRVERSAPPADLKGLNDRYAAISRPERPNLVLPGTGTDGFAMDRHGQPVQMTPSFKSIGQQFIESQSYKAFNPKVQGSGAGLELPEFLNWAGATKATFTTAASTFTQYLRPPGLVLVEQQRLTIANLLMEGQTDSNTIRYQQEDSFTNAATSVAEGATKPEASFDTSEVDAPVRKIAVTAKVSDELWNDFPAMQSYIDGRMRFMVDQREEALLLNGDGVAPNILGILSTTGIQNQAVGTISATNTVLDNILRGVTKVRSVGFYEPDGIVIHPSDYQILRLSKDNSGQYYGGGPFFNSYGGGGFPTQPGPWGLTPVITTAIAAGTALVGAFRLGAMIFRRAGVAVQMTNSNEADFKQNLLAIRAEERLALAVWRPKAFCTVTGIA